MNSSINFIDGKLSIDENQCRSFAVAELIIRHSQEFEEILNKTRIDAYEREKAKAIALGIKVMEVK
jgi:hypothetical protein